MSKINELIKKLCPNGVEYQKLGNLLDYIQPSKYIVKDTNYKRQYNIPVLTAGQTFILGYTNEDDGIYEASKKCPVIIFDDFTTSNKWVDFSFKVKSSAIKMLVPKTKDTLKYIYYCMNNIKYSPKEHSRQWIQTYSQFEIPLPPIEVQEEIVKILDKFGELESDLESELESELEARKSQYEFWLDKLFDIDECDYKTTEELFEVITDYVANGSFKSIANNVTYKSEKDYSVLIRTVDYSNGYNPDKFIYIDKHAYNFLSKSKLYGGEIIINNVGAGVGTTFLCPNLNMPMSLAPNTIMLKTPNNKFYYYWFNSKRGQASIESITSKSAMPKFNKTGFRKLLVPVPTIQEQEMIVSILDMLDKLVNDITRCIPAEIELRRQQYEYYKNKLLSFEEFLNE